MYKKRKIRLPQRINHSLYLLCIFVYIYYNTIEGNVQYGYQKKVRYEHKK